MLRSATGRDFERREKGLFLMISVAESQGCGVYFAEPNLRLARQLDGVCEGIAEAASAALRVGIPVGTIVLGGGYGRGEGGIWRAGESGQAALHNDLDFFLFSDRPDDPRLLAWVEMEEKQWTSHLGIHVDFACLSPRSLDAVSGSMMLTDLALGYRQVFGAVDFIDAAARRCDASRLPLWEASRLLWNRGTGLYFARCRIAERSEPGFVERNQQKLALALGDALLCLAGKHDPSVEERGRRLKNLPMEEFAIDIAGKIRDCHRDAVEFKLQPRSVDVDWGRWQKRDESLTRLWAEVFLRVESVRLGRPYPALSDYAGDRRAIVPETFFLRNLLIAMRDKRRCGQFLAPAWDYPRGALMRCLAAIHNADTDTAATILHQPDNLETAYTDWWQRYQ